jgi:phage head maturation protease
MRIRGYANLHGVKQQPIAGSNRPLVVRAGAFSLIALDCPLIFGHNENTRYASTRNDTLRVWEDATGLAFEADVPNSWAGASLANGIARGDYDRVSMLLKHYSTSVEVIDGEECDVLNRSRVGEISVITDGACPGTACWLDVAPIEDLPPHARALAPRWIAGKAAFQIAAHRQRVAARAPAARMPAPTPAANSGRRHAIVDMTAIFAGIETFRAEQKARANRPIPAGAYHMMMAGRAGFLPDAETVTAHMPAARLNGRRPAIW